MAASCDPTGSNGEEPSPEFRHILSKQLHEVRDNVAHGIEKVQALLDRRLSWLESQLSDLKAENQALRTNSTEAGTSQGGDRPASVNTWTNGLLPPNVKQSRTPSVTFPDSPVLLPNSDNNNHGNENDLSKNPDARKLTEVVEINTDSLPPSDEEDEGCDSKPESQTNKFGMPKLKRQQTGPMLKRQQTGPCSAGPTWASKADDDMDRVLAGTPDSDDAAEPSPPNPQPVNGVPEPRTPAPIWSSDEGHRPSILADARKSTASTAGRRVSFFQRSESNMTGVAENDDEKKPAVGFVEPSQNEIEEAAKAEQAERRQSVASRRQSTVSQSGRRQSTVSVASAMGGRRASTSSDGGVGGGALLAGRRESEVARNRMSKAKTFDSVADVLDDTLVDKITNSARSLKSFVSEVKSNFEVLPVWTAKRSQYQSRMTRISGYSVNSMRDDDSDSSDDDDTQRSFLRIWLARRRCFTPNSAIRAFWDAFSCFLVFYDMVTIPLELMEPGDLIMAGLMSWVTRIFWTLDMPASLTTGFVDAEGSVELHPYKVMKRYFRTWFLFDVLMVSLEWIELLWGSSGTLGFMRFGRTSRALRIIRMVRLLRLIRIREVLLVIAERIRSERLIIAADIGKIIVVIVSFAHVVGCVWFGIGNADGSDTWVKEFNMTHSGLGVRYANSIHWSLTQFSGGMDEIRPQNITERVYAVLAFLFAFLMASVLVSRLTSSMTRLHMLSNTQAQQLVALRRYLGENGISHRVALRVQKNAQHAILEQQRFMPEHKVELLHLVSEPLRMEVHFELYHQVMSQHPFFGRYTTECPHVMRKVCHHAASQSQVCHGDLVFSGGEIPLAPKMYFVNSGTLQYVSMGDVESVVTQGQWISEMALWTLWMHRGCLTATSNCRMSVLDAAVFQDIVALFEHPDSFDPRRYAHHFVAELNKREDEITDLVVVSFPLSILKRRHSKAGEEATAPAFSLMGLFLARGKTTGAIGDGSGGSSPRGKGKKKQKMLQFSLRKNGGLNAPNAVLPEPQPLPLKGNGEDPGKDKADCTGAPDDDSSDSDSD